MSKALATQNGTNGTSRSVIAAMSERFGMEPAAFEATLRATVVPKETTREQFAAFLLVAKEHGLNPLTKEIYAFPTKGGGVQPIVSIDGWMNLMNSHPQMNGLEFDDKLDEQGKIVAVTARVWRKDRDKPVEVTEYLAECKRNTEPWTKWPARMLRHKAAIQAARYAFGFAGIIDPDEAERFIPAAQQAPAPLRRRPPSASSSTDHSSVMDAKPAPAVASQVRPGRKPPPAVKDNVSDVDPETGELFDEYDAPDGLEEVLDDNAG